MRVISVLLVGASFVAAVATLGAQHQRSLEIYSIDVEGGNSVLFVSPSGESLLFDAGNPGPRDADQIAAAAKEAGVKQINYLVISHWHGDHFGSVPDLSTKLPIRNFIDHGPPMIETSENSVARYNAYAAVRDKGHYTPVKPGDKIPIKGLDVRVVTAGGRAITSPLPGGGAPNPLCSDFKPIVENAAAAEDGRSTGIVVRFGRFRAIELGDLTWTKEHDLACPNNLVGTFDLYFTDRHGIAAGSPTFVHALKPRIAIFDNGARKGESSEAFLTLENSPGIEDIWQLHYGVARPARKDFGETTDQGGKDLNAPEEFIANLLEEHTATDPAHNLKISAREDGGFSVTNGRTGFSKEYKPRS
ncbi:MAG TPA: MBL fold metallo-hydrolase [Rugosimonospora sp.]|nr:MBL fold metallo-hydrolase [Rugosimonospora sp.]